MPKLAISWTPVEARAFIVAQHVDLKFSTDFLHLAVQMVGSAET